MNANSSSDEVKVDQQNRNLTKKELEIRQNEYLDSDLVDPFVELYNKIDELIKLTKKEICDTMENKIETLQIDMFKKITELNEKVEANNSNILKIKIQNEKVENDLVAVQQSFSVMQNELE